jgi:small subunit ribosomal protein S9
VGMDATTKTKSLGRRKEAVARVRMAPGTGIIMINGKPCEKYFVRETDRIIVKQPLIATNTSSTYDISANLRSGGLTGQAGALRH